MRVLPRSLLELLEQLEAGRLPVVLTVVLTVVLKAPEEHLLTHLLASLDHGSGGDVCVSASSCARHHQLKGSWTSPSPSCLCDDGVASFLSLPFPSRNPSCLCFVSGGAFGPSLPGLCCHPSRLLYLCDGDGGDGGVFAPYLPCRRPSLLYPFPHHPPGDVDGDDAFYPSPRPSPALSPLRVVQAGVAEVGV